VRRLCPPPNDAASSCERSRTPCCLRRTRERRESCALGVTSAVAFTFSSHHVHQKGTNSITAEPVGSTVICIRSSDPTPPPVSTRVLSPPSPAPTQPPHQTDDSYDVPVDPKQQDKATTLKLNSFKRPHMRAFHFAWFGFFMAFVSWFAFAPLMKEIKGDLGMTKNEVSCAPSSGPRRCSPRRLSVRPTPPAPAGEI